MKRVVLLLAFVPAVAVLGACGAGEVVVQARLASDSAGAEPNAIENLQVHLLPYDRDAFFDSLSSTYPEPEPPIPDSLLALQEQIAEAQAEWQRLETAWNDSRARLQTLSDTLQVLNRAQPQYVVLFREFNDLEPRVDALSEQYDAAFREFTELQNRFVTSSDRVRALRTQWANEAFAPIDSLIAARLDQLGVEEKTDTTTAAGVGSFPSVEPGEWWVHARYELPYSELYWNEPISVTSGEPITITLTPENAEVRRSL